MRIIFQHRLSLQFTHFFYWYCSVLQFHWSKIISSTRYELFSPPSYMGLVQRVLSLVQILNLSPTSHLCMGLPCMEIIIETWINFSSFINACVFLHQKFSAYGPSLLVRLRTFSMTLIYWQYNKINWINLLNKLN